MKLVLATLVLLTSNFVFANTANEMTTTAPQVFTTSANLNKGNIQIGGGFSFTDSAGISTYTIDPQVEYFVMDSLSVGGRLLYFGERGSANPFNGYGVGPSASYYFYKDGPIATYIAQSFSFVKLSNSDDTYSRGATSLGVKYFAVPQVAFGVALTSTYNTAQNMSAVPTTSLGGNFSFYY